MNLRKGVAGFATSALLASGLMAGVAFADESYQPTTLGNSSYTNHIDLRNDIYVDGMNYVGSMSAQNSDYLDETAALSHQIGTQGENAYALRLTNKLSQGITKLEVKGCDQSAYTELALGGSFAAGEEACWWYTQEYREYNITNKAGIAYTTPVNYTFKATLADGSVAYFHDVNMNGVQSIAFRYSDAYGVYYVERMTITNHTPDPNLLYEYNLARGFADDSDETYSEAEFNYHVNSAARMDNLQFTASRGAGFDNAVPKWSDVAYAPDFGVYVPLYGEPSGSYTNGTYAHLYWNPQLIKWRQTNGDAGEWGSAGAVEGAGEYGGAVENLVDYHPGMEQGNWNYTNGE